MKSYIHFRFLALQGEVNGTNYFYFTRTNHGNSLEINFKTSNLIDISMHTHKISVRLLLHVYHF